MRELLTMFLTIFVAELWRQNANRDRHAVRVGGEKTPPLLVFATSACARLCWARRLQ